MHIEPSAAEESNPALEGLGTQVPSSMSLLSSARPKPPPESFSVLTTVASQRDGRSGRNVPCPGTVKIIFTLEPTAIRIGLRTKAPPRLMSRNSTFTSPLWVCNTMGVVIRKRAFLRRSCGGRVIGSSDYLDFPTSKVRNIALVAACSPANCIAAYVRKTR